MRKSWFFLCPLVVMWWITFINLPSLLANFIIMDNHFDMFLYLICIYFINFFTLSYILYVLAYNFILLFKKFYWHKSRQEGRCNQIEDADMI